MSEALCRLARAAVWWGGYLYPGDLQKRIARNGPLLDAGTCESLLQMLEAEELISFPDSSGVRCIYTPPSDRFDLERARPCFPRKSQS